MARYREFDMKDTNSTADARRVAKRSLPLQVLDANFLMPAVVLSKWRLHAAIPIMIAAVGLFSYFNSYSIQEAFCCLL